VCHISPLLVGVKLREVYAVWVKLKLKLPSSNLQTNQLKTTEPCYLRFRWLINPVSQKISQWRQPALRQAGLRESFGFPCFSNFFRANYSPDAWSCRWVA